MSHNGRVLRCSDCRAWVRVYEAVYGASEGGHEYLEELGPYSCGECLESAGAVTDLRIAERLKAKKAAA